MSSKILEEALKYAEKFNFSVIPVRQDKKPLIKWEEFQKRRATREEIIGWFTKMKNAMIGIVTGSISNIFVIDCDTEEGYGKIQELMPESLEVPIARTPRGGWHMYYRFPDENITIGTGVLPGVDYRGEGGYIVAPPSNNGNGKAYTWMPGLSLAEVSPPPMPENLLSCLLPPHTPPTRGTYLLYCKDDASKKEAKTACVTSVTSVTKRDIWQYGVRDENLFHVANCLAKTGNDEEYIRQTLRAIMSSWGETDEKWINTKIESAFKRIERKERNLAEEIRQFVSVTLRDFSVTECDKELGIVTLRDKATRRKIFQRLKEEGIIEHAGNREGWYRLNTSTCRKIDFLNADTTPLRLNWPLGVHELVELFPKSIAIIAGSPNAGKTAYLLNLARKNMERCNTMYFSSEMGDVELRIRLEKFGVPLETWERISFLTDFKLKDLLKTMDPDGLNIIDYLEIYRDFYEVSGMIADIFDRLEKGIAIIAIQKPTGRDTALGGERTLEKARLYLAIEAGQMKIVKGKIWRDEMVNPNGMSIEFKLAAGCKFTNTSPWRKSL